jgi:hypothetical protein
MSAGSVLARIVLDDPTRCHFGPKDPVKGHVSLQYRFPGAYSSQSSSGPARELFGPLKIVLTFGGRVKTKIYRDDYDTSSTYRGRAPLFSQRHEIFDGPYTSKLKECVRFPFSLNFPVATQHLPGQGGFRQDARFQEARHSLPPTFNISFRRSFEAFVEYRLNAEIRMPGIDISLLVLNQRDGGIPILYEQPQIQASGVALSKSHTFAHSIVLQNEHLLPEEERPTGFRQKLKFALSSQQYPIYIFTIRGTIPSEVFIGQPLILVLALHPDQNRCTAPVPPAVQLRWVGAKVRQYITVRAEHDSLSSEESSKDYHLHVPRHIVEPHVPFSDANDYTKVVHTSVLNTVSSFSTYNIYQRYTLEIQYGIFSAGKEKTCKHTLPITVHPPVDDVGASADLYAIGHGEVSSPSAEDV